MGEGNRDWPGEVGGMGLGFSQSLLHCRRTRLLGGGTQSKLTSSAAILKMPTVTEVYSFHLVGGTGRFF